MSIPFLPAKLCESGARGSDENPFTRVVTKTKCILLLIFILFVISFVYFVFAFIF